MRMLLIATLMLISGNAISSDQYNKPNYKYHRYQIVIHSKNNTIGDNKIKENVVDNRFKKTGIASWYGYNHAGKKTASGSKFNPTQMTAAHKFLKFGTKLKVTNLKNNMSVIVTITDRGPYIRGRSIDLSMAAAKKIGMYGIGKVEMQEI